MGFEPGTFGVVVVWTNRPAEAGFRSHSRQTICLLIPNYTTSKHEPKRVEPYYEYKVPAESSGTETVALMTLCANLMPIKPREPTRPTVRSNADRFTIHTYPQTVVGTSQNSVNLSLKDSGERSKSERCLEIKFFKKQTPEPALPSNKKPSV
jgi:hypothetical protein